jgi:hypothetical protein
MTTANVIGWLLIGVGAALLLATGWLLVRARRSTTWPSISGRVVSSKRDYSASGSKSGGTNYRLLLTYAYEVAGNRREGHRVAFGDNLWSGSQSKESVDERVKFYHPGREVTVYYDPERPDSCTLTQGLGKLPFNATFVVAAALVFVGVAALSGWIPVH